MTFSYGSLATKATSLIKNFGRELTFTRTSKGTYNPNSGTTTDTSSTFSKFCCVFDYSDTLLSEPFTYQLNDTVSIDSEVFRVINVTENKPAATLLSVDLQVRK